MVVVVAEPTAPVWIDGHAAFISPMRFAGLGEEQVLGESHAQTENSVRFACNE